MPGRSSAAAAANNQNNCTGYWGSPGGCCTRCATRSRGCRPGGLGTRTIVLVNRRPGRVLRPGVRTPGGFSPGGRSPIPNNCTNFASPRTKSPGSTGPPGVVFQGRRGQDDPDSAPMSSPTPIKPRSRCPEQQPDDPEPEQFYWYRPGKPDGRRPLPPRGVFYGNIWVIRYLPLYLVGHAQ